MSILTTTTGARNAIALVADRSDNTGTTATAIGAPLDTLIATARQGGVPIYVYGYGPRIQDAPEPRRIALESGGRAVIVPTAQELTTLLPATPFLLRPGYELSYRSQLQADDAEHTVAVGIAGAGEPATGTFQARGGQVLVNIDNLEDGQKVSGQVLIDISMQTPAPVATVSFISG